MNHFFALEMSQDARQAIAALAQDWRQRLRLRASWYDPADYHVTLKFLGDVPEESRPGLIAAAAPVASQSLPFVVQPQGVGAFPDAARPSVLWAGVQPHPALTELAARVDQAVAGLGFQKEKRPYTPHITLARVRAAGALVGPDWPEYREQAFPSWAVGRFVLMQTLPAEGRGKGRRVRYNTVHLFPLGDTHS